MKILKGVLSKIYQVRYFDAKKYKQKGLIWKILCEDYLQKYVGKTDTVLDIAAGHCEFINNIFCRKKYAVDIDKRVRDFADKDVEVFVVSATSLPAKLTSRIDTVFMGCFLEHLSSKDDIIRVLLAVRKVLKKNGKLLILNPNIRFSTSDYWDYFDHLTPVSDRSAIEILSALGFTLDLCLPKFVPNTLNDRWPKSPFLVKLYLHLPILFPIFGRQMFIVARKK